MPLPNRYTRQLNRIIDEQCNVGITPYLLLCIFSTFKTLLYLLAAYISTATFTINHHLPCLWSKIGTFQVGVELCKRAIMPILNKMIKNTNESFEMRYCMEFFFQGHQNCQNFRIYLIKTDFFRSFNFVFWQFWCPLRKNCIQYLIWKLSLVVLNL